MVKRILIFLSSVIFLSVLFWYSNFIQNEFYIIVDFFNTLVLRNEFLAVLVFIFSAVIGALISPLTNLPLVPFAVTIWGALPTAVFLLCGWIVGDLIAYVIGRYFGRKIVTNFLSEDKLDKWSNLIKRHTNFITALIIRLTFPAELGYIFGLVRYHLGLYLLVTFLAELPFAFAAVFISEVVLSGEIEKFIVTILILIVIIIGLYIKFKSVKKSKKQIS